MSSRCMIHTHFLLPMVSFLRVLRPPRRPCLQYYYFCILYIIIKRKQDHEYLLPDKFLLLLSLLLLLLLLHEQAASSPARAPRWEKCKFLAQFQAVSLAFYVWTMFRFINFPHGHGQATPARNQSIYTTKRPTCTCQDGSYRGTYKVSENVLACQR